MKSIHAHYGGDMAIDLEEFKLEVNRWRYRWSIRKPTDPLPQTLVETLDVANAAFYPGIYVAVKTLLTYPVSACAAECSFSSMKRLKTPLRNTMTDHRLSSLAILRIHKEKEINVESVLDKDTKTTQRKTPRSLLINDNCTIKTKNATERMLEDPQPKQCCVCTKFAQNKGKTLCSLLVFTQLFRSRNKERSIFRLVYLGF